MHTYQSVEQSGKLTPAHWLQARAAETKAIDIETEAIAKIP